MGVHAWHNSCSPVIGVASCFCQKVLMEGRTMQGIRAAIIAHNNATLPDPPPRPRIVAYGNVALTQQGTLLDHIPELFPGKGIYSQVPQPMEDYGEGCACLPCRFSPYCPSQCLASLHADRLADP